MRQNGKPTKRVLVSLKVAFENPFIKMAEKNIAHHIVTEQRYLVHSTWDLFFLLKESEVENPIYFLIITMLGNSSKNRKSAFLFLYLISLNFLVAFLQEWTEEVWHLTRTSV